MLATLCEEIYTARRPWETTDAATMMKCTDQSAIDRCLCCCHASSACDYCDGRGNVRIPKKQENLDTLRELMKLPEYKPGLVYLYHYVGAREMILHLCTNQNYVLYVCADEVEFNWIESQQFMA